MPLHPQAGSKVDDAPELAELLTACYAGLGACHLDRVDAVADRRAAVHKAIVSASRALEIDPAAVLAVDVRTRAQVLLKAL
jgi:hypothetical protein